jgi:hypothetical protein
VNLAGTACTLYPASTQGAVMPRPFNFSSVIATFNTALLQELGMAGLDARMPVPGLPDLPVVVKLQILKADPGSRLMRYLFTWFAGAAVFEVAGAVGDANAPFAQVRAGGTRRASWYGGNSDAMLADAARMAGQRAGKQIVAILGAR